MTLTLEQINQELERIKNMQASFQAQDQQEPAPQEQPEQVQTTATEETRTVREWETPAHEEVNLATVNHEDLGLDPYDYSDPLVKAIYRAQINDPYPHVPTELKTLKQWVTWSGDTKSKEPYVSGTARQASTSNPSDLVDYGTAIENIKQGLGYANLGLVPFAPYLPLDLDSCRNPETGDIQPWAVNVLNMLPPCYTEITPSGTGLRPWVKMPSVERRKIVYSLPSEMAAVPYKKPQAELLAKNYGTISGQRYRDCPSFVPEVSQEQWANRYSEYPSTPLNSREMLST